MRNRLRGGREILGIFLLFGLFLIFVIYSERVAQETTPAATPSMHNAKAGGVKALNLLLEQQGYKVADLRSPWNSLNNSAGLIITIEPFEQKRPIGEGEIAALTKWVQNGGHLLYLVAAPERPYDPRDSLTGDIAVVGAKQTTPTQIKPKAEFANEPVMQGVGTLNIGGQVRLQSKKGSPYRVLARDKDGDLILEKTVGNGKFWAIESASLASNTGIGEDDNAVFLVNLVTAAVGTSNKMVLFDEYHHGVGLLDAPGSGERGLLAATPIGIKLAALHLLLLTVLVIYNGNRLFGRPKHVPVPQFRSSTDFLGGVARLYKRAGATDIAVGAMHQAFVRDLTSHLMLTPDAPTETIIERTRQRHSIDPNALSALLATGAAAQTGKRVSTAEMVRLAEQYDTFRRKLDLAGNG